jgi:hypothetical protein
MLGNDPAGSSTLKLGFREARVGTLTAEIFSIEALNLTSRAASGLALFRTRSPAVRRLVSVLNVGE